jgi:hypothetical protein
MSTSDMGAPFQRRSRFETLPTEPVALWARLLLRQKNVGTLADPHLGMRFLTPLG